LATLAGVPGVKHRAWVHAMCGTHSEANLGALIATSEVGALLCSRYRRAIFVEVPPGAIAWKRADPFLSARWLYEESDVCEAAELDSAIVVRVPEAPSSGG
jgi:hypothetical protein